MNLDDLRAVQANERDASGLQPLDDSFYRDVAAYLASLRAERDQLAAELDDPFSNEEIRRLTDEIETATEVTEAIYDRRVGKVVKRASLAAAGMSVDRGGLTSEEAALFEDLVDQIEANRAAVLDVIGGDTPSENAVTDATNPESTAGTAEADQASEEADREQAPDSSGAAASDTDGAASDDEPNSEEAAASETETGGAEGPERITLRITEDVGEIYGVDERVYELGKEDVVTLPAANAGPLLDQGAAVEIDN